MMTKDQLEMGMIGVFERYEILFKNIDCDKVEFLQWIYVLENHDDLRKGHSFVMTRLLKMLIVVYEMWCYHNNETWCNLFLISEDSSDVKKIKGHLKDLYNLWKRRPKPKRKGSNLV